jgi:Putative adhesin
MEPIMHAPWRLAALAIFVIALPAQAQHHKSRSHRDDQNVESRIDTTVTLSRSGTVDLQSFSGDITVVGWDRNDVKIHATSEGQLRFDSSPSRISLVESPQDRNDDDSDDDHTGFEISMPKSGRLLVRTLSGDIKLHDVADVEGHSVSGDIDVANIASHAVLESISGDVTVIHVTAGVRVNTVSGEIHAKQITGEVAAQSVSGDVVLDDITSSYVRSETVSGEVHFSGPVDAKGRYEFHSHSGDVDLNIANGASDATLEVETYSGDLDTSCSMTMQPSGNGSRMGKRGTFTIGHGGGAHFILKTFSGDVHITGCRSRGDK